MPENYLKCKEFTWVFRFFIFRSFKKKVPGIQDSPSPLPSLVLPTWMYSNYKSHTIVKSLVGIVPCEGFTFISSVFSGSISDKHITVKSRLPNCQMWEPDEELMVDREFTIEDYLSPSGVKFVIPSFLKGQEKFTKEGQEKFTEEEAKKS